MYVHTRLIHVQCAHFCPRSNIQYINIKAIYYINISNGISNISKGPKSSQNIRSKGAICVKSVINCDLWFENEKVLQLFKHNRAL